MNQHILVTGGTGFFGLALFRYWQNLGVLAPKITILSRNPQRFQRAYPELAALADWIQGDVMDVASLPMGLQFSHVIHGATDSTLGPLLTPHERFMQVQQGTQNILNLAIKSGKPKFLYISSGGIYGPQPDYLENIPEHYMGRPDPVNPNNAYSMGKRSAEKLCDDYQSQHQLDVVIARCFSFVGPDLPLNVHFAIGNFIWDALYEPQITVISDGTPVRSYMDQRDLARWLNTLLTKAQTGSIYNVGADDGICMRDLAFLVRDLIAPQKTVNIIGQPETSNLRNRYVPSTLKIRTELKLKCNHSLEDAILNTAKRFINNRFK